jgi:hypothetical protein
MRNLLMRLVLASLLLGGMVGGCYKPAVREKPVPDPLLTSKKPVQGRHPDDRDGPAPDGEFPRPPAPPNRTMNDDR